MSDLLATYMRRFRCIGSDCEDDCCHGWRITLHRACFDKLQTAYQREPRATASLPPFEHAVEKLDPTDVGPHHYAATQMASSGDCVLLDERRLCRLHAALGEAYLPLICASYPRWTLAVEGRTETTGLLSCPEVVRQLLRDGDDVTLAPLTAPLARVAVNHRIPRQTATLGANEQTQPATYLHSWSRIQAVNLELLALPGHDLRQRLFFTCFFAHRVHEALAAAPDAPPNPSEPSTRVEAIVGRQAALLRDPQLRSQVAQMLDGAQANAPLALALIADVIKTASERHRSFAELVGRVLATFRVNSEVQAEVTVLPEEHQRRREALRRLASDWLDRCFERIATNHWLQGRRAPSLVAHALRLLMQIAVVRFLLINHPSLVDRATVDEAALEQAAVEVIYRTARAIQHCELIARLEQRLDEAGLHSLGAAVQLLAT